MLKEFVEVVKTKVSMGKLGSIACGSSTGRSWARRGPQPREVYSLERLQLGSCGLPSYQATRLLLTQDRQLGREKAAK